MRQIYGSCGPAQPSLIHQAQTGETHSPGAAAVAKTLHGGPVARRRGAEERGADGAGGMSCV